MQLIIECELDGEKRVGVLSNTGGAVVATVAGRTFTNGAELGIVRALEDVDADDMRCARKAGFDLQRPPGDALQTQWAGPIQE